MANNNGICSTSPVIIAIKQETRPNNAICLCQGSIMLDIPIQRPINPAATPNQPKTGIQQEKRASTPRIVDAKAMSAFFQDLGPNYFRPCFCKKRDQASAVQVVQHVVDLKEHVTQALACHDRLFL